ncbi:MAG: DUF1554 domain-containing protein [Deltaproteobacteria bacterium]|nr:DUF1554 domain-containing protein [Deltaproteobacteria bacterium]
MLKTSLLSAVCMLVLFACSSDNPLEDKNHTRVIIRLPTNKVSSSLRLAEPFEVLDRTVSRNVPAGDVVFIAASASNPLVRGRFVVPASSRQSSHVWTVPSGNYYFALIGYSGSGTSSSTPVCALAIGDDGTYGHVSSLVGGTKNIAFDTARGNCAIPPFGAGNLPSEALTISLCNKEADISMASAQDTCIDFIRGGQTVFPVTKTKIGFFSQNEFVQRAIADVDNAAAINSGCVSYSRDVGTSTALSARAGFIPAGSGNVSTFSVLGLKTEIVLYSQGNCEPSQALATYTLNRGLAAVNGSATAASAEPAITMTFAGKTEDISDRARFVVTGGVPRLFIKDSVTPGGYVDSFSSTLSSDRTSLYADGTSVAHVTLTLLDGNANPVSGKTVTLQSRRGTEDSITPSSAVTDSSGKATFTLRSVTVGTARLFATDTTDTLLLNEQATIVFTSPSSTPPTVGTDIVFTSAAGVTMASWGAASDAITPATSLKYKLVYSTTQNIGTVADAEANGAVLLNWAVATLSHSLSELTAGSYYVAVLVKNGAGIKALYSPQPLYIGGSKVLYTVSALSGNLGGVSGADSLCMSALPAGVTSAKALIGAGSYRHACTTSFCSGGVSEHVDWVLYPNTQYIRASIRRSDDRSNTVIGTTNSAGVFASDLTNSVLNSPMVVYTGLNNDWTDSTNNCQNWTSPSGSSSGTIGDSAGKGIGSGTSPFMLNNGTSYCYTTSNHIYCAEQ